MKDTNHVVSVAITSGSFGEKNGVVVAAEHCRSIPELMYKNTVLEYVTRKAVEAQIDEWTELMSKVIEEHGGDDMAAVASVDWTKNLREFKASVGRGASDTGGGRKK